MGVVQPNNEQFAYVTTIGRKTGLPRQIEIWFVEYDGGVYVLAEHGYRANWVQNIQKNPEVQVRIGKDEWTAKAHIVDEAQESETYLNVRQCSRQKYNWGDGLPVRIGLI